MAQIDIDRASFRPSYRPQKTAGGFDPDVKRMGLVAAGIGGALAVLVGISMLAGHHHHGVPVIEADAGPVRVKPLNAGGEQFTGAENGAAASTTQALAPAAEQPQINALRAQLKAMKKDVARQAAQTAQIAKLAAAGQTRIAAAPPVQRASATARIAEPEAPPAKPAAPTTIVPQPAGAAVQLAAFTDEKAAQTGWDTLLKKTPDLLGGRTPEILKAQAAGRIMWRLRTGGFTTVAEAASFCAKMRDHGADCSIAAF
jgi:hypothetical protein